MRHTGVRALVAVGGCQELPQEESAPSGHPIPAPDDVTQHEPPRTASYQAPDLPREDGGSSVSSRSAGTRLMRRAGLRIPDGLSVIGIDDHPVAELTGLTTVRQPVREQGELAGRMLLDVLRGEETEHDVVVPKQLVIRGSAAPSRS